MEGLAKMIAGCRNLAQEKRWREDDVSEAWVRLLGRMNDFDLGTDEGQAAAVECFRNLAINARDRARRSRDSGRRRKGLFVDIDTDELPIGPQLEPSDPLLLERVKSELGRLRKPQREALMRWIDRDRKTDEKMADAERQRVFRALKALRRVFGKA